MIDDYFQTLMSIITASPIVRSHQVEFDKRDPHSGYVRGNVYFADGSFLHWREFVNTEAGIDRFTYAYHYQKADGTFVFRYDNSEHFPQLENYPHHKHVREESNVLSTTPPDLASVLKEIESMIIV